MAEIRVKYLDAKNATSGGRGPCMDPFVGNTYREAETGDLVLPEGWTPTVVNYYLDDRENGLDALRWMANAKLAGSFQKLVPSLTMAQIKAWIENRPT